MALEARRHNGMDDGDPNIVWKRRLAKIQRRLRRAESWLEIAASDVDQLADDIEMGAEPPVSSRGRKKPSHEPPLPIATQATVAGSGTLTFLVHGAEFRVELTRAQIDLVAILKAPTKESTDVLVGFKTMGTLVHALRLRGWDANGRSITVEISRLRAALGTANRGLIETCRGVGYRFRLLRSVAAPDRGTAA